MVTMKTIMNSGGFHANDIASYCILMSLEGVKSSLIGSRWLKIIRLPEGVNQNLVFCGGVSSYWNSPIS